MTSTWVTSMRRQGLADAEIRSRLADAGWDQQAIAGVMSAPPQDSSHWIAYTTLMFSSGFAVVSLGTFLHMAVEAIRSGVSLGGEAAALSLTIFLFSAPFALLALRAVQRIEEQDPHAVESPVRNGLGLILVSACAIVGATRLFWSIWRLVNSTLLGDAGAAHTLADLTHIGITTVFAGLFGWVVYRWLRPASTFRPDGDTDLRTHAAQH